MWGQIIVTLIFVAIMFSYTATYKILKKKLIDCLMNKLKEKAQKEAPVLMVNETLNMMNKLMEQPVPRHTIVIDRQIFIPFTLHGKEYTVGMKFDPDARDVQYRGVTPNGDITLIRHHPGVPFLLKPEQLGFHKIQVVCGDDIITYEKGDKVF